MVTEFPTRYQALPYGEPIRLGEVTVTFAPAGHVLGSAQAVLEHSGARIVVSGDYKRRPDPTCPPFQPVPCDVFVTEATFALPVFRHPSDAHEIGRLLHSLAIFPERAHLVGTYALGKCQRVISLLRQAGYDRPIYMHGALLGLCALYERHGVPLGPLIHVTNQNKGELKGQIVLAPPSAHADRWSRALPDPVVAMASGWMRIKQRAKARRHRAAAGDLRPCRLGRAGPHGGRGRRARGVDHARPRGGAGPSPRQEGLSRPRARAGRLRGGGE